ncbi:MAG TPA: flagellar motor switch protein FliM [Firmicutes bacterium]|nr:flagellar motor switch protein FliM [Bacillota bacterium]HHT42711.1 flagellar motor switch protein FliM [Bacillota bacterium]
MQDILSQEEIDLLIRAASEPALDLDRDSDEGSADDPLYDFSRPNKFSKEHIRALHRIHEQFCRTYTGYMSAKLRHRVDVKVHTIEQILFGDFVRSLPNPSVLSVYKVHPLEGYAIVQFTPDIAFLLHDRLCGGDGIPMRRSRSLTDIEIAVLKRQVLSVFSSLLSDAWRDVSELEFELDYMESNPQFLQIAAERDAVALITMRFSLNETSDMISICLPHRTLEPIIKNLTHIRMFESLQQPDPQRVALLKEQVRAAEVPVEVELGRTAVTVGDLLDLAPGDVVLLDRKKHETLDVKIGSMTKFKGTPGRLGARFGVVITTVLEPAEGGLDDE